jgi:hypothetical protein
MNIITVRFDKRKHIFKGKTMKLWMNWGRILELREKERFEKGIQEIKRRVSENLLIKLTFMIY